MLFILLYTTDCLSIFLLATWMFPDFNFFQIKYLGVGQLDYKINVYFLFVFNCRRDLQSTILHCHHECMWILFDPLFNNIGVVSHFHFSHFSECGLEQSCLVLIDIREIWPYKTRWEVFPLSVFSETLGIFIQRF